MTATHAMLRLNGIRIYKVRAIVTERKRGGKFEDVYRKEVIIIDNLSRAQEIYKEQLNECETWFQYSKYQGRCELFEPTIHDNGEIAYFPHDEKTYIKQLLKGDGMM
jgi:hypothetical protein